MPLYIFEERYRTMTRETLEGSGELVIALLQTGEMSHQPGVSAVYNIACLGKIETYEELEDGKYNIVVVGVRRVKIIREIPHSPYRLVEVEILEDTEYSESSATIVKRHNQLAGLFSRFTELATGIKKQALELMPQLDFESLVNMVAMTLNLPIEQKQTLLEMDEAKRRCDMLIPILKKQLETLILIQRFEHIKPENPDLN